MKSKYEFEERFREQILRCSSCGFCQAHCPVYGSSLRPALNARGKMLVLKEVMDGPLELNEALFETLCQCTTCGNCEQNCPAGVSVPDIIKAARRDLVNLGTCHPAFAGMKDVLEKHPNIYAEQALGFGPSKNQQADIVYFIGCVGTFRQREITEETLKLFDRLKVNYTLIDEACCSGVLEDVGHQINTDHVKANIDSILATGAKTLVTGCPYCLRTFNNKKEYKKLEQSGIETIHISQFLNDFDFGVTTDKLVTYHDPCDLGRHAGIYEEPRVNIRKFAPNFVELPHHHADAACCGSGGGVRAAYAKNAVAMGRRRLTEVDEVHADVVLTECNSCVHNLSNAKLRKQPFEIYHTTQFLNKLLEGTI